MRYKFFVGLPHQKIHHRFYHSILKGDYVTHPCGIDEENFPEEIFRHDGSDVVWFFNDIYFNLHPQLKGRQVFTLHGLSFKKWANTEAARVPTLNNHIDLILSTGPTHERDYIRHGVKKEKIRKTGYTLLFEIPNSPIRPNTVLFYCDLHPSQEFLNALMNALGTLDEHVDGYLTLHPENSPEVREMIISLCKQKKNVTLLKTQEELLEAFAYCQCCAGGLSSVSIPFFFSHKPAIFIPPSQPPPRTGSRPTAGKTPPVRVSMNARDNPAAFWRGCFFAAMRRTNPSSGGGGMPPKHGGATAVRPWGSIIGQKGNSWLNKWKLASGTNAPFLFHKVLRERTVFTQGMRFTPELIQNAKVSNSAKEMFYSSNFNKEMTTKRIQEAVRELERRNG